MNTSSVLVIPCYNEELRMPRELVLTLAQDHRLSVLLVDDGSSDGTAKLIESLVAESDGYIHGITLAQNSGKAEAVRVGMNWALTHGASRVGFADADFATPPIELIRLMETLESQGLGAVLGCRVARLGAHIERHTSRHIISRVFAMLASACLRITVYDTQCGAKWFRVNDALQAALATPFASKWAFDVELLGRLLGRWGAGPRLDDDDILEIPIRAWRDVGGSKVSLKGMLRSLVDMVRMAMLARKLGAAHTAKMLRVPIESTIVHPRNSWRPTFRMPTVPPRAIMPLIAPNGLTLHDLGAAVARAGLSAENNAGGANTNGEPKETHATDDRRGQSGLKSRGLS